MLGRYADYHQHRPILERYVQRNLFELSRMDQGATLVTEKEFACLETDTTLVMSVVIFSKSKVDGVECPLCKTYIVVTDKGADRVLWYVRLILA